MSEELRIPKIGMSATEMILAEWMFADGDRVEAGETVYTVETDKTTSEIEAPIAGTLRAIGTEGETYKVGDLIGRID